MTEEARFKPGDVVETSGSYVLGEMLKEDMRGIMLEALDQALANLEAMAAKR